MVTNGLSLKLGASLKSKPQFKNSNKNFYFLISDNKKYIRNKCKTGYKIRSRHLQFFDED
jgi:hypothetical protein